MTTATATKFRVYFTMNGEQRTGQTIVVCTPDKESAAIEAQRAMVRFAKGYEAKWGIEHCHDSKNPNAYVVYKVRKVPTPRAK